jgi:hypothetical protein
MAGVGSQSHTVSGNQHTPDAIAIDVSAINANGDVTGTYGTFDTEEYLHGFLRTSGGTVTAFVAPGAGWSAPVALEDAAYDTTRTLGTNSFGQTALNYPGVVDQNTCFLAARLQN